METLPAKWRRKWRRSLRKRLGLHVVPPLEEIESPEAPHPPLPADAKAILDAMYAGAPLRGSDGELHTLDGITQLRPALGWILHDLHARLRPALSVEIGLAYGFSTLFFLSAMKRGGYGRHFAMDPFQTSHWHGIGATHAESLEMAGSFQCEEAKSIAVLPRLIAEGVEAQLVFIDGNHRYDDVLVDFTLSAEIVPVGGWIVLDDLWMPSIQRVRDFLRTNRTDFAERDVGHEHFAAFERVAKDKRKWDHYVPF